MIMIQYVALMESSGYPLDKLSILTAAKCTGENVGIMLDGLEFWTTRRDNKWQECEIFFAYIGDNVFVPIERIDMGLLNKVASQVPLYEYRDAVVKPKKSRKQRIASPTETSEVDDGKCKEITDEIIVVSEENATGDGINNPKKRGSRPKNVSQKECEKDDMFEKPKRGHRPKNVSQKECEKDDMFEKPKRGHRPKNVSQKECEKDDVFEKPKRGHRPKNVSQKECEKDDVFEKPKRGHRPKNVSQKECEKDDVFEKPKEATDPKCVSKGM